MPDASEAELAWLAGLLEGEGSFWTKANRASNGKSYPYPFVTVNMTDRDVIERVAKLFQTSVYDLPVYVEGRKPSYRAQVQGTRAAKIMRAIRPWMGVRRGQKIDQVLAEYEAQESTAVRRKRSCSQSAESRIRNKHGQFEAKTAL